MCHIKNKEKNDLLSGEKYEQITNNLTDDIFSNFADAAQMVMVGAFDREINAGKLISEKRALYLRGNSQVDAGGRFTSLPEKINLDVEEFMNAFEGAVKASIKTKVTDKSLAKMRSEEEADREKKAEVAKKKEAEAKIEEELEENRDDYIAIIQEKFQDADADLKKKAKELLASSGVKKFTDPELNIATLKEIAELF